MQAQLPGYDVGSLLGPGKDQHAIDLHLLKYRQEQPGLEVFGYRVERLLDRLGRTRHIDLDTHRVTLKLARQGRNRRRHRGREEHRLALAGHTADDLFDVRQKAHIQHPVGLVQHENLQVLKAHVLAAHMIHQAPRRGDDDVDAPAQFVGLLSHPGSAIHGSAAQ
jgi:hypothetical protein